MNLIIDRLSKRIGNQWIFSNISATVDPSQPTAILGPNGSGKSTLLKVLIGWVTPTRGTYQFLDQEQNQVDQDLFKLLSFVAPYIRSYEYLTVREAVQLHFSLNPTQKELVPDELLEIGKLAFAGNKLLKELSSGMLQRLHLLMGIFSEKPVLLLDEPCTNLDVAGIDWYQDLLTHEAGNRLILIASNREIEYRICKQQILLG